MSLKLYTKVLPELLIQVYPSLSDSERVCIFADLVSFYGRDSSARLQETNQLLKLVLTTTRPENLAEAIIQTCKEEHRVRALIENWSFCSFNEPTFTSLVLLFASKHATFEVVK